MHQILIIGGTKRQGNYSQQVSKLIATRLNQQKNIAAELINISELDLNWQEEGYAVEIPGLQNKVDACAGLVIVCSEYNHSFPGSLKYVLDSLEAKPYHKPVALVGVSSGPFGGTRALEQLGPVLRTLGFLNIKSDLNIGQVQEEIQDGQWSDPEKWNRRLQKPVSELLDLIAKLN